jgi:hypothetical protein
MATTTNTDGAARADLDEELAVGRDAFEGLLSRLNDQSVRPGKHFDAYVDVPWDEHPIDPADPRWELGEMDPLGGTTWYRSQPQEVRAAIGLHLVASKMQVGYFFEGVLKRGLLEHAATLPAGSAELRYVYHEVIEEAQHSLMFQEFVNRTGIDLAGLVWWQRIGARQVMRFARTFPELFFVFVLGGEDPIDHVQRTALRSGRPMHPLLKRIMQIHVTEEARHLCFARHYLKRNAPNLGPVRRFILSRRAPFILAVMAQIMMQPSSALVRTYGIPKDVIREAYTRNPAHRAKTFEALHKVRDLLREIGVVTPRSERLWRWLGIWPAPAPA